MLAIRLDLFDRSNERCWSSQALVSKLKWAGAPSCWNQISIFCFLMSFIIGNRKFFNFVSLSWLYAFLIDVLGQFSNVSFTRLIFSTSTFHILGRTGLIKLLIDTFYSIITWGWCWIPFWPFPFCVLITFYLWIETNCFYSFTNI